MSCLNQTELVRTDMSRASFEKDKTGESRHAILSSLIGVLVEQIHIRIVLTDVLFTTAFHSLNLPSHAHCSFSVIVVR